MYKKKYFCHVAILALFAFSNLQAKSDSLENSLKNSPTQSFVNSYSKLDYNDAVVRLKVSSDKYRATQAAVKSSLLEAEAYDSLRYPQISAYSLWTRYKFNGNISLGGLSNKFNGIIGSIPNIPGLPITSEHIKPLPGQYDFEIKETWHTNGLMAILPIYEGGKISAVQNIAKGKHLETQGMSEYELEELNLELLKRYFGVQLAKKVLNVREIALKAVKSHYDLVSNMLKVGLVSKVDKLQADVALRQAEFEVSKAKDDLKFALSALNTMLKSDYNELSSKLFINSAPLPSLQSFQSSAKVHNPVFTTIDAKQAQAKAYKDLKKSEWMPKVAAFGARELKTDKPYWGFGLNATWTLFSNVDRRKMDESAQEKINQVEAMRDQMLSDIDLLIEQKYIGVQVAKDQYFSLVSEVSLAKEIVKLRLAGFKEGLSTFIDLNDAQANLAKAQTGEAKAAYDYVLSLSALLQASGQLSAMPRYIQSADIKITEENR